MPYHQQDISDLEEDSSEDEKELESYLYSQIHHREELSQENAPYHRENPPQEHAPYLEENLPQEILHPTDPQEQPTSETGAVVKCLVEDSPKKTSSTTLLLNPLYSGSSESSDDEGIVIVSEDKEEIITISSDTEPQYSSRKKIELQSRSVIRNNRKRKNNFYIAKFGSDDESILDSDDSIASDSSIEILDENFTLNLKSTSESISCVEDVLEAGEGSEMDVPKKWNKEMRVFYCKVNKENLHIEKEDLQSKGPSGCWKLDPADTMKSRSSISRYFNRGGRCNNCSEIGHFARDCPEPVKQVKCFMCGEQGHRETRCPENCCLGCGQPGLGFQHSCGHCRNLYNITCKECGFSGHLKRDCPDLWRRYHQTIEGDIPQKHDDLKLQSMHWCCNCGRKGHLIEECRKYIYAEYPATSLKVIGYSKPTKTVETEETAAETSTSTEERKIKKRKSRSQPTSPSSRGYHSSPSPWNQSTLEKEETNGKKRFNSKRKEKRAAKKMKMQEKAPKPRWEMQNNRPFSNSFPEGSSKKIMKRRKFFNDLFQKQKSEKKAGSKNKQEKIHIPDLRHHLQTKAFEKKKKKSGQATQKREISYPAFIKLKS